MSNKAPPMLVTGILYAALASIIRTGDERCAHVETSGRISVAMGGGHDPYQYGENRHSHTVARFGGRMWGDQAFPLALFRAGS